MPANHNPRTIELLSWHGHSGGGVHVPFQVSANPLGATIETPLIRRLRKLAADIAAGDKTQPRWIVLVGGPGNGKSETVQDFLTTLDHELKLDGALVAVLTKRFTEGPVVPRKVEVGPPDLGAAGAMFDEWVGKLVVVQDATATELALGNAAKDFSDDVTELLTSGDAGSAPIFLACANRGLLARALNEAVRAQGADDATTRTLRSIVQASSLGRETLDGRPDCWPLGIDNRFACWPLDVDSLVDVGETSPLSAIVKQAVADEAWDVAQRCGDCDSRVACPFFQNAQWLKDEQTRTKMLRLLRHGELARGQRWNFRDAFSLVAELLVGQWDDFQGSAHPCSWVHDALDDAKKPRTIGLSVALTRRLLGNSLFARGEALRSSSNVDEVDAATQPITAALMDALSDVDGNGTTKAIRELLANDYERLDPATSTPADIAHPLRRVEDAFCQSIDQGTSEAVQVLALAQVELAMLDHFNAAEKEWDVLGRNSAKARAQIGRLRNIAGALVKRSLGARLGAHALEEFLEDYATSLRDPARLLRVRDALMPLLGENGTSFDFNLVEVLGQPPADVLSFASMRSAVPGIIMRIAPSGTERAPGHDVPCAEIAVLKHRIPLTFEFFMALQLRRAGCAGSSLPSSVRAALDRVRHRYSGKLCRDEEQFLSGQVTMSIGERKVSLAGAGEEPILIENS